MNQNKAQKKTGSAALMAAGLILFIISLAMDFAGTGNPMRGPMLVAGITAFLVGLYLFPSKKHHRKIVYILFLFPLLFTFGVTVIIPLVLGIGYSFTDWNGIRFTQFVGFANYAAMFRNPAFIYSVLITVAFVIANIVLVNVIAFLLALNIYNTAISKNAYALGQAKAVFFFIILAAVSLVHVRISNKREVEM